MVQRYEEKTRVTNKFYLILIMATLEP